MFELKSKADYESESQSQSFRTRYDYTKETAWFILTDEVATALADFLAGYNVVEVFAGSGHLAHHLRERASIPRHKYKAYDNQSTHSMRSTYPGVTKKNAFMAPIKKADVVIMTWPPYDTNHAERIVKKMRVGQVLIYNGEGWGGCTGNDEFFSILEDKFEEYTSLSDTLDDLHVRFDGIHDHWSVYVKTQ